MVQTENNRQRLVFVLDHHSVTSEYRTMAFMAVCPNSHARQNCKRMIGESVEDDEQDLLD